MKPRSVPWLAATSLACALSCSALACGSSRDERETTNGSGGGSTGGGAAGAEAPTSTGGTGGGGAGGAPGDCEMVPEYIDNLYQAAAECAPADPGPHCQDIVDGYCCPVVVESINSPSTLAYLDFLDLTRSQCPEMWQRCRLVDCALPAGGVCTPDDGGTEGHCEPQL